MIRRFPGVQYVWKEHAGQAAARNFGLQFCQGQYVANLDSDDAWKPGFVRFCLEKMQADQLDFVFANWDQQLKGGGFSDFLAADPYLEPYRQNAVSGWFHLDNVQLRALYLKACPSPSSSALIRRSSIFEGWNRQIKIGDDWCFYLDMILFKGGRAAFTMEKLWIKNVNDTNIYDGRPWHEVLRYLYIHDVGHFMTRYKEQLTARELFLLRKQYVRGLVELAKHTLIRDRDWRDSFKLLRRSFGSSPLLTFETIPKVIVNGLRNHTS